MITVKVSPYVFKFLGEHLRDASYENDNPASGVIVTCNHKNDEEIRFVKEEPTGFAAYAKSEKPVCQSSKAFDSLQVQIDNLIKWLKEEEDNTDGRIHDLQVQINDLTKRLKTEEDNAESRILDLEREMRSEQKRGGSEEDWNAVRRLVKHMQRYSDGE